MKMILKTMVCLAVAFPELQGQLIILRKSHKLLWHLKSRGIRLWNIRLLSVNYRIVISIMSGKQRENTGNYLSADINCG